MPLRAGTMCAWPPTGDDVMQLRTRGFDPYIAIVAFVLTAVFVTPAWSFCGFFAGVSDAGMENSGTQTVVARDGRSTTLTLSFNYRGEASDFSVIFPVPVVLGEEDVRVVDRGLIERLDMFTAPRAVHFPSGFPGCPFCRSADQAGPAELEATPVIIRGAVRRGRVRDPDSFCGRVAGLVRLAERSGLQPSSPGHPRPAAVHRRRHVLPGCPRDACRPGAR